MGISSDARTGSFVEGLITLVLSRGMSGRPGVTCGLSFSFSDDLFEFRRVRSSTSSSSNFSIGRNGPPPHQPPVFSGSPVGWRDDSAEEDFPSSESSCSRSSVSAEKELSWTQPESPSFIPLSFSPSGSFSTSEGGSGFRMIS